ncbi:MAG: PQQ-dependent sugar dehydrogenase [Aestuariivirga sp.]
MASSGLAFYNGGAIPEWKGSIFVGALPCEKLVCLERDGGRIVAEGPLFENMVSRIRDIVQGPARRSTS